MIDTSKLKIYLIQNPNTNQFLQWVGYSEITWTEDIREAKIWLKLSTARGRVTSIFNQFPDVGICSIVEVTGGEYQVHNEQDRVEKQIQKRKLEEISRQKINLENKQVWLESQMTKLQDELAKIKQTSF